MAIENMITDHLDLWTAAVRPKSSAGRGSNSKLELTGIKKLRELILELAVRGKLVPQDPSDEPASVLLERIAIEKARLVKEGKIKKPKALPAISEEEKPFELPEGWTWQRLGSIGYTQTGGTPSKSNPNFFGNDIPFIKPGDISDTSIVYDNEGLSTLGAEQLGRLAPSGSILMVCIGTIGKCNKIDKVCAFNQQINSITPYIEIYEFLHRCLSSRYFQALAWENSSSTTIAILNKGKWEALPVPLPPIFEQHRIVAKVDELMALCDQLEQRSESQLAAHQTLVETLLATLTDSCDVDELAQNWARLSTHFDILFTTEASIDALKQTILQLAVMGKLVPQDPSDEPASSLLERIAAEKAQLVKEKKIKKEKPLSVIREDEKPFELPQGWEWERFGKIFLDLKYGTSQRSDYLIDGNPVLRIPNVAGGAISLDDLKFSKLSLTELNDLALTEGDLLFIRSNGSLGIVGRCVVVDICLDGFAFAGYLVRSRMPKRDFCSHFISLAMDTSYVRNQIEQPIRSTSGVKNINSTEISNLIIPVPPLLEQHRIVAKVNELMVICDQLKSRLQTSQQTQLALAESLVEGALA
ncbi:hypothetical protein AI20_11915 [Aeromonas hydrophila YL17]|nr:hypothetical protein AI20_11915 [Aeromonas hydrophila YL17]